MANRHFAKIADVWKHLPLVEILSIERPRGYWESHAGSAAYAMSDDAERRYGALRFFDVAPSVPSLASSRYLGHLRALNPLGAVDLYPGSSLLAMRELGTDCSYGFCDLDPDSVRDLDEWATRLVVDASVVGADGMAELYEKLLVGDDARDVFVHVDPYNPWLAGPTGVCALDLAAAAAGRGCGLMYWYGYSCPEYRAWAFDDLAARATGTSLWCGDIMVESRDGGVSSDGDLGVATTPGTGFGIVTANISRPAVVACASLGAALAAMYADTPLPDGTVGRLDFITRTSA
jgi:hypothetical protein